MIKIKAPCARDCQERSAECRIACEKWAEYVKRRDEAYEERIRRAVAKSAYDEHVLKRVQRCQKHKHKH